MPPFRTTALAAGSFALLFAARVEAFERQWRLGAGVGLAGLTEHEGAFSSPAFGLHGAYGVSDLFDVLGEVVVSSHSLVERDRTWVSSMSAGLAYKLDVVEWVPYFGVLAGYYRFTGPRPVASPDQAGAGLVLGLDYALQRDLGLGAQLRYHGFMDDLPGSVLGDGPYFTTLLRAEYRWGY